MITPPPPPRSATVNPLMPLLWIELIHIASSIRSLFSISPIVYHRCRHPIPQMDIFEEQKRTDLFLLNYELGKTIGFGTFGKVKIAKHLLTGQIFAIKILEKHKMESKEMEDKVRREIRIMRLLRHPHIIRLNDVIETQTHIYIVMEYAEGGDLFDYMAKKGRLQEDEGRCFFRQIISGVECCHLNMVAHRDLKPENLLLDSSCNVKLADFGLSKMFDGNLLKTSCGSAHYAAPEVISGKLYAGPEVDVWSCGIILYVLICGKLPFDDVNIPNMYKKMKAGMYSLPPYISIQARDLIPRMLTVDPMKRITIREIREHPWFKDPLPCSLAVPPPPSDAMHQDKKHKTKEKKYLVSSQWANGSQALFRDLSADFFAKLRPL